MCGVLLFYFHISKVFHAVRIGVPFLNLFFSLCVRVLYSPLSLFHFILFLLDLKMRKAVLLTEPFIFFAVDNIYNSVVHKYSEAEKRYQ